MGFLSFDAETVADVEARGPLSRLTETTTFPPSALSHSGLPLALLILRRVEGCLRGVSGLARSGGLRNAKARLVGRSAPPMVCL